MESKDDLIDLSQFETSGNIITETTIFESNENVYRNVILDRNDLVMISDKSPKKSLMLKKILLTHSLILIKADSKV